MKVKVINTGKSAEVAEKKLQEVLDGLNIRKLISISDSGLRAIIVYEEENRLSHLTGEPIVDSIGNERGSTKEPTNETKNTTNKRAGSKAPKRVQKNTKPKK